MAFDNGVRTVGTTPTSLGSIAVGMYITNTDAASIFIGGPKVTTTTGIPVVATTGTLQVFGVGTVYAVSAAGTAAGAVKCLIS
jgi:hypothetical protein